MLDKYIGTGWRRDLTQIVGVPDALFFQDLFAENRYGNRDFLQTLLSTTGRDDDVINNRALILIS